MIIYQNFNISFNLLDFSTMFNLFYGESKIVVNKYSGKIVEFDQGDIFIWQKYSKI